jgi:hypothetical protein
VPAVPLVPAVPAVPLVPLLPAASFAAWSAAVALSLLPPQATTKNADETAIDKVAACVIKEDLIFRITVTPVEFIKRKVRNVF